MTTYKSEMIEFRAGRIILTEAQWTANTNVYPEGIIAITSDGSNAGRTKVFDGVKYWSQLLYNSGGGGGAVTSDDVTDESTLGPGTVTGALDTLAQNVSDQGTAITYLAQILPTVYEAIGSSTTASEETNQFVNTFTFTNPIPGRFEITADSGTPFTVGKTRVTVGVASNSNVLIPSYNIVSTSVISFRFYDITGTEADPAVWSIYIRVYP